MLWLLLFWIASGTVQAQQRISLPRTGLIPEEIAVIINDSDPLSQQVGNYYQKIRNIPKRNVIRVKFSAGRSAMSQEEFQRIKTIIDNRTPGHVQGYAVAWTAPYRVECMSLTAALAFGFDTRFCAQGCEPTEPSRYFNSISRHPYDDHQIRPAMMLAGTSFENIKALIDRGVQSDHRFPKGQVYLLQTSDPARNTRASHFEHTAQELAEVFPIQIIEADFISNRDDVFAYFTGMAAVSGLTSIEFQPGALADHLTSAGGMLTDSPQMSSLRWLEAGATASYGTVVEPCSFPQKFPAPGVALFHYATGATVLEAYWKSVAWPGQGVFIGEPLAKPFAPALREVSSGIFELRLFSPRMSQLRMEKSASAAGPFKPVPQFQVIKQGENIFHFRVNDPKAGYIRLSWH